jgi:hypothetical protein
VVNGKNATNLRNHIKSKHKEILAALLSSEKQQRPVKVQKQNINSTDTTEHHLHLTLLLHLPRKHT